MPRNSSGNYTLPAGNPVVSDTIIAAEWANPTLADLASAVTDSLDRYGRGGMQAEFKIADGITNAPGLSFVGQSNLGVYRKAANVLGIASAGGDVATFSDTTIVLSKPLTFAGTNRLLLSDGTAAMPALGFASEAGMGLYRSAAGSMSVAVGGVEQARFGLTGISTALLTADGIVCLDDITALGVVNATDAVYVNQLTASAWSGVVGQKAGLNRWMLRFTDNSGEAAGNQGSDFTIMRSDNAGAVIAGAAPLTIRRSTGATYLLDTFATTLTVAGPATVGTTLGVTGKVTAASYEIGGAGAAPSKSFINNPSRGNVIYIDWNASALVAQVDSTYFGANWPISITGNAVKAGQLASGGTVGGTGMTFTYVGSGSSPVYVWGSNGAVADTQLYVTTALSVATANNALNLGGRAASGWVYGDWTDHVGFVSNKTNYPYMWQPGVGVIGLIRNVGTMGGISQNPRWSINYYNEDGVFQGYSVMNTLMDDEALLDVAPTTRKALPYIRKMDFIQYRHPDEKTLHRIGFSGKNLKSIDPQLVREVGEEKHFGPDPTVLLPVAFKALQELEARVAALEKP